MEQKKLKHSKYKNTGIIFELLTQKITSDILEGKNNIPAKDIVQKFFSGNNILSKELKLYQLVLKEKIKNEDSAYRLLETIIEARKKLSNSKLKKEKYELISEIKKVYDINDFFTGNISNYKIYASLYKLFENSVAVDIFFDPKEIFEAKNTLIENIVKKHEQKTQLTEDEKLLENFNKKSYSEKILTYKILVESFNNKYKNLSEKQKNLLRMFVNSSGTSQLKEHIQKEFDYTINTIKNYLPKIDNEVTKIKLSELLHQLNEIKIGIDIKDNHLTCLLMSYELIGELEKSVK